MPRGESMKLTILDAATLGEDLIVKIPDMFRQFGEVDVRLSTSADEVSGAIADTDVIIVNKIKLNQENLACARNLKLICETATGYDNLDIDYCKRRGIAVCNVVGYSTHSVAQLTILMALTLINHLPQYTRFVDSGEYTKGGVANKLSPVYHEICGKVWGIVGLGNIGRQVARVAEALGCRVIVNKRTADNDFDCVDIDTLCKSADIISVHTPLTEETKNLISRERIALMKNDTVFINVARGAVADEEALAEAILEKRLGGLGIDVYSKEPFPQDHPYNKILGSDRVCLTPHTAWGAYEARLRCLETVKENIIDFINGGTKNRID